MSTRDARAQRSHTMRARTMLRTVTLALAVCLAAPPLASAQTPGAAAPLPPSVKVGDTAPDFTANYLTAADANGKRDRKAVKLSEFRGQKNVVLAFFPAAFSPGCTSEMAKYRESAGEFNANNTVILGMRVHYLDWGTPGLPPVLFLHGGGLNVHTWDLVCAALKTERHCLALDQRGHGDSEWSPVMDYSTESHAGDLEAFVDHLGLDRFVLVGMSLGGANALAWAGAHSRRLAALVLVDVGPEVRQAGVRKIAGFTSEATPLDSVEEFVTRALAFNPRRDATLLRRSLLHNLRRMPDGKWMWKYDQRHRGRALDPAAAARRRELLWSAVAKVSCPTLVVRGAESDVFHDEDAERLARALPAGRWVTVAGAGHTVQGDNPAGLLVALREFLGEVAARR